MKFIQNKFVGLDFDLRNKNQTNVMSRKGLVCTHHLLIDFWAAYNELWRIMSEHGFPAKTSRLIWATLSIPDRTHVSHAEDPGS